MEKKKTHSQFSELKTNEGIAIFGIPSDPAVVPLAKWRSKKIGECQECHQTFFLLQITLGGAIMNASKKFSRKKISPNLEAAKAKVRQ